MNGLKVVCEVRRCRLRVYLMLSGSFAMKVSRGEKQSVLNFYDVSQLMKQSREVRHSAVWTTLSEKVGDRIHLL